MKNLYFLVIGGLFILFVTACSGEPAVSNSFTDNSAGDSDECTITVPCGIPEDHLISIEDADLMGENYMEFYEDFNSALKRKYGDEYDGPGNSVWFSLDDLKQYIAYIESYADGKDYTNLGLRVYYGIKESKGDQALEKPYMTVFFAPTAEDTEGSNEDMEGIERMNYGHAIFKGKKKGSGGK